MSKSSVSALILLASTTVSTPVSAQRGETVAQFLQSCQAEGGRVNGRCDSYIEGAADTLAAFGSGGNVGGICGRGYRKGQLARDFMAWAPRNRNAWDLPRLAGVTFALRQAHPCRQQ